MIRVGIFKALGSKRVRKMLSQNSPSVLNYACAVSVSFEETGAIVVGELENKSNMLKSF